MNDAAEANELVSWLMALAELHAVAIIGVLHLNPGSQEKSRGHLGSQLDRKSQTSLQIDANGDETRSVYTSKARKRPLPKAQAVRFEWSDDARGFVELEGTPGEIKQAQNVEEWRRLLYDVQAETNMLAWKHKDLVKAIMDATGKTDRTARTRISDMLKEDLLKHDGNTGMYTSKLPTAKCEKRHNASNEGA